MARLVDVYLYKQEQNKVKHLLFKRAAEVIYPNQWRMIGGKGQDGEKAFETALRELKEETNLSSSLFWTIPSLNSFYEHQTDSIHHIPAFAAEIEFDDKQIQLNHEHVESRWILSDAIDEFILWPEQQRLMKLLTAIVTKNQIQKEWIINV